MDYFIVVVCMAVAEMALYAESNCVDKSPGCSALAERGLCEKRPKFAKLRCRKTCNVCDKKNTGGSTHVIIKIDCVDKMKGCNKMKARGWCKHHKKRMEGICQSTCGFCGVGKCIDARNDCNVLKRIGFCEKRPNLMKTTCEKTCGLCPDVISNNVKGGPKTYTATGCVDTFGQKRCEYYAHIGYCTKKKRIKKVCRKTCVCDFKKITVASCNSTAFGCCPDNKTTMRDKFGGGCSKNCRDDPRFITLCTRFAEDCKGTGGLAKSVRKYCTKTCHRC